MACRPEAGLSTFRACAGHLPAHPQERTSHLDFHLYYLLRFGYRPSRIAHLPGKTRIARRPCQRDTAGR